MLRGRLTIMVKTHRAYTTARPPEHRSALPEREIFEGLEIEGFKVTRITNLPEFNMKAYMLKHFRTHAEYLHLARDDVNNTFGIAFRTTANDSKGLPHILKRVVLCGSNKYPVRSQLNRMMNRSLAAYVSSVTDRDYTLYPFSTQNRSDFTNLLSVYLDTVFRPLLRENDFRQEGWRLECEKLTDKTSPIVIRGAVYEKMKLALLNNQTVFSDGIIKNILPSNTYSQSPWGHPDHITETSYEELKEYHAKYYHPSNCKMYSYGNFPLIEHLSFINSYYLCEYPDFNDYSKKTEVPNEPRWSTPRQVKISCRNDPSLNEQKQTSAAISSLCVDIRDCQNVFTLQVLFELMLNVPNSPFYKAFTESNVCLSFNPVTGYDCQKRDTVFSIALQGVNPLHLDKVENIYDRTIDRVIDVGFDETSVQTVLHNIELTTKHQTTGFGLSMLFGITPVWNHGGDVIKAMKINHKIDVLKRFIADNSLFLQNCVQEYFKENCHKLVLIMTPDENYEKQRAECEDEIIKSKTFHFGPTQREKIFLHGIELTKEHEAAQDESCLPIVEAKDLNADVQKTAVKGEVIGGVPVQIVYAPTNGVTYFKGVLNVSMLSEEAKSLLPLFCEALPKMGTSSHDCRTFDLMTRLRTGGLHLIPHVAENIYDVNSFEEGVIFSSSCLDKNFSEMMSLWKEIFKEVDLENEKQLMALVKSLTAEKLENVAENGHAYAILHAASLVSPSAKRKDQFIGLTCVQTLKGVEEKNYLMDTLEMLQSIKSVVFRKKFIRSSINTLPDQMDKLRSSVKDLFDSIDGYMDAPFYLTKTSPKKYTSKNVHFILPGKTFCTSMCIPTVEYAHTDFPALRILASLLELKYLPGKTKENGVRVSAEISNSGVFSFYSCRDPNPFNTFEMFDDAKNWAYDTITDNDVELAKMGLYRFIDASEPPGARGNRNFLYGINDTDLKKYRRAIKEMTKNDVMDVTSYLKSSTVGRCLLGPSIGKPDSGKWTVKTIS